MQECRDAGMKPLDLIWVDTDKSVDPTREKIRSRLCAREYKTKKQGKIQRALPASQLFSAMPPLEAVRVLVSIMMSVRLSNKGKPLKLRHCDISEEYFQDTMESSHSHLAGWLCEPHLWRVRKLSKRPNTVQHCSTIQIKM